MRWWVPGSLRSRIVRRLPVRLPHRAGRIPAAPRCSGTCSPGRVREGGRSPTTLPRRAARGAPWSRPKAGGDAVAAVSPLQAHAGNRATATLLGGPRRPSIGPARRPRGHDRRVAPGRGSAGRRRRPRRPDRRRRVGPEALGLGAAGRGWRRSRPAAPGDHGRGDDRRDDDRRSDDRRERRRIIGRRRTGRRRSGHEPPGGRDRRIHHPARRRRRPSGRRPGSSRRARRPAARGRHGSAAQASAVPRPGAQDWTQRPEGAAIIKVLSGSSVGQEALAAATKFAVIVRVPGQRAARRLRRRRQPLLPRPGHGDERARDLLRPRDVPRSPIAARPLAPPGQGTRPGGLGRLDGQGGGHGHVPVVRGPRGGRHLDPARRRAARRRVEPVHARPPVLARGAPEEQPNDAAGAEALSISKGRALVQYQIVGVPNGGTLPALGPDRISSYADFYRRQWNIAHRARP